MPDLGQDRDFDTDIETHLADHLAHNAFHDAVVVGPFSINKSNPNIDTGITLWTPNVGDRIFGITVEFTEVWDVVGEKIGLGPTGTADDDLGFLFPVAAVLPTVGTWDRGIGLGTPWGASVIRIKASVPILARTILGGNITGALTMWVHTLPVGVY